ncbi:MAG: hypothetical protein ACYSUT_10665 [Planctomycetota bacterium]
MKVNMKLSTKMIGIGGLAVIALTLLYGVVFFSNRMVKKNVNTAELRNEQINTIRAMRKAQLDLVLAAMDSIIDKAEGDVSPERLAIIDENAGILNDNVALVTELADTDAEKQLAQSVAQTAPVLSESIQKGLVELIRKSGAEVDRIEAEFVHIDDILDKYGDTVGTNLLTLEHSLNDEVDKMKTARQIYELSASAHVHLIQTQQWLTDISATRGAEGYDDGFDEAEQHAAGFRKDTAQLREICPEITEDIDGLVKSYDDFYQKGKWMAKQYIEGGHEAGNKAMDEFDTFAEDIGTHIEKLLAFASTNSKKADQLNGSLVLANHLEAKYLELMLAAMDSIIDRADGKIEDERMAAINEACEYITTNIAVIKDDLGSPEFKQLAAEIQTNFVHLEKGVKEDLIHLIENSALQLAQIEADFVRMDDVLDEYSDSLDASLAQIEASVNEEVHEASETMIAGLGAANVISLIGYVSCAAGLSTVLFFVTLSIVKLLPG